MSLLTQLRNQKDGIAAQLEARLEQGRREGRKRLTRGETRAMEQIKQLNARICDIEAEEQRGGGLPGWKLAELRTRIQNNPGTQKMNSFSNVYTKHGRNSYVSDLVRHQLMRDDTGECRRRLESHTEEVQRNQMAAPEYRDISRIDGQGGYFVPPAWLTNEWVEFARPGRPFANLLQAHPLPGGTDSINVPKILTGATTAIQTTDNEQVSETDITDTFINSPVRTIAGQQSVALQLIDQSPIAFDDVILQDLTAAHAVELDKQTLYGTGVNGQLLGVNSTPRIGTLSVSGLTIQGVYSAIANAIQTILTTRFRPPTHIVMHPRRWAWLLQLLDENNRPLFVPVAGGNQAFNAAGIQTDLEANGVVGNCLGLPIVVDANISTQCGLEYYEGGSNYYGTEDEIIVLRSPDVVLYSSGVRARVLPEPLAQTLTVLIQLYSYEAIAVRFPSSIVAITGFTPPTF